MNLLPGFPGFALSFHFNSIYIESKYIDAAILAQYFENVNE